MRCVNPIRIKNSQYPENSGLRFIDCACGKCYNCLVNRRRLWFFRLSTHALYSDGVCYFVSLDYHPNYNDKHLHKNHLQKFFKRLRHHFAFKYYAIGEYGTKKGAGHNPHYHILMFCNDVLCKDFVELCCHECWTIGRVDVGYVEPASINYVLHYHVRPKKPFGDDDSRKTFCCMSQGLGLPFLDNNLHPILQMIVSSSSRRITNQNGDSFVLPRYYVRKLADYGVDVKQVDADSVDYSRYNLRELVDAIDKRIEYYNDGRVKEQYDDLFNSIVFDILQESKRKLSKYDHQEKF